MSAISSKKKQEIKELLNKLNLGTSRAALGEIIIALIDEVDDLKARVKELEGAGA